MRIVKALILATATACGASCGPEVDGESSRGDLVYADSNIRIYRLDRRVEIVAVNPMTGRNGCGYLTDRAHEALETTIEALDPSEDYVAEPERCEATEQVYIEGFAHSPFPCSWLCCHPDLAPVATVYFAIIETLYGGPPNIEGEPYVALDPDRPCE